MGVVRRRQLKRSSLSRGRWLKKVSFFSRKIGWHHQLLPRVTPTLVTPLPSTPTPWWTLVPSSSSSSSSPTSRRLERTAVFVNRLRMYNAAVYIMSPASTESDVASRTRRSILDFLHPSADCPLRTGRLAHPKSSRVDFAWQDRK